MVVGPLRATVSLRIAPSSRVAWAALSGIGLSVVRMVRITGDDESEAIQHADPRFLGEIAGLWLCTACANDAIFWGR
ncbi:hypothetical protein RTE01_02340 [Raoultella terrigena]|nr:hypothetical protein RTE01_02340 [Raoultella terrigena]